MSPFDHQWKKLTTAARQSPADRDLAAPYGFANRVVARSASAPASSPWAMLERLAVRGLVVAAAFSLAAVTLNFTSHSSDQGDDYSTNDTIGDLLDLS